jgi:hypothetical protein
LITQLDALPDGVIGFEASGKIAAEDYRDVVMPAIEEAAKGARPGHSRSPREIKRSGG